MITSRREFIRQTASVTAFAAIGQNFVAKKLFAEEKILSGNPLKIPVPFAGNKFTIEEKSFSFWPGAESKVFSLTGSYQIPLLRIKRGETLSVNVENKISDHVSIHWHGMELPANMDGHPMDAIMPGMSYKYEYKILNRAGTYFFHSHTHEKTGEQVFRGLAGILIVEDDEEQALDLPRGEYDIPMLIQDLRFGEDKKLLYDLTPHDKMVGYTSDKVAVNGTLEAFVNIKRGTYRLRLINASNARIYKLAFSDKRKFFVIASDGGLLEKPVEMDTLLLAPAERYEILVDFSSDADSSTVMLRSEKFTVPSHMGEPEFPQGMELDILRFEINGNGIKKEIPKALSTIVPLDVSSVQRVRNFEMNMKFESDGMKHTINSRLFDMGRVDEVINLGDTEIWEIRNMEDDMLHPMHIHGVQFQILSRNGNSNIPEHERGWKDTFLLNPFETARVILKFDKYEGIFLMHCHNLEHEDDGMMMNFRVEKTSSVEEKFSSERKISIAPNPCDQIAHLSFAPFPESRSLTISDTRGKIFFRENISPHIEQIQIPVWQIPSGNYFCTIGRSGAKLIISR